MKFSEKDLKAFNDRGVSTAEVEAQLDRLRTGFPYLRLRSAATPGDGILIPDEELRSRAVGRWEQYLSDGGSVMKMVPASGAASRMFKALFSFVEGSDDKPADGSDVARLIDNIEKFAFYADLDALLIKLHGLSAKQLIAAGRHKDVVAGIIMPEGLNYGNLPKGLLKFHHYPTGDRTPLEEQLTEAIQTTATADGNVSVHFTVSPDHRERFEEKLTEVIPGLEGRHNVKIHVSLSEQLPSTDTVAATPEGELMHDADGKPVFRPGGHGALIRNLNDLHATVVFIKNIDNVVPDSRRGPTVEWKKVLAGILLLAHDRIAAYLDKLNSGNYDIDSLREMIAFLHDDLNIRHPEMKMLDDSELALYIKSKLNRPLRVCGMVRNEGEPGGGPYLAYSADGSSAPQILESTQIDPDNKEYASMMASATHFNPVDLVCYISDPEGNKYDLPSFVDPATGFISSKSLHGHPLKALELPGLWNGAMSDWSTIFVDVPIETFNPVKTVNDLLRPTHSA